MPEKWAHLEFCCPGEVWSQIPAAPRFSGLTKNLIAGYNVILETFLMSGRVQPQPNKYHQAHFLN